MAENIREVNENNAATDEILKDFEERLAGVR